MKETDLGSRFPVRRETSAGVVYHRRGSGRPIVLLHGWCLNRDIWCYEEDLLASGHDVITPDLPGFGLSAGIAGPYDMQTYVHAVRGLLDELDLTDVVLVGFAFGAAVGMTLAAQDGSRLGGLVAVGVPSAQVFPAERMARSMRRDWPDFARRSAAVLCKQPQSEATIDWIERMFRGTALSVGVEAAALLGEFEPEPVCPAITVPALFVHGADDDVIPVAVSERCADLAPAGRFHALADCGHLAVIDQRQAFHDALAQFLGERS